MILKGLLTGLGASVSLCTLFQVVGKAYLTTNVQQGWSWVWRNSTTIESVWGFSRIVGEALGGEKPMFQNKYPYWLPKQVLRT